MPAGLNRVRETMDVKPTPRDKGLTLTLRVTAYDNGMLELDGVPLHDHKKQSPVVGWLAVSEVISTTISEFHRQVQTRTDKIDMEGSA
ncbi:hypothetical protein GCM10009727_86050 [Actinomadura napierensis]|uniref:Uncharacterized protein n=2 Tax=Actinomadura napierensis TaxID=267854 RepID=A0ABP5M5T4_9ACTN